MFNLNKKNVNLLCNIFIVFISLFCMFFLIYLHQNSVFYGDDFQFGTYSRNPNIFDGFFKYIFTIHGGGIISLLLTRLTCFTIPLLLGIHPADFICREVGIIQSIFLIILFITYLNFLAFSKRVKILNTAFYLFICTFYLYTTKIIADFVYSNNNNFWRYPFTFIFFNILFLFFYKTTTSKNKKISTFQYALVLLSCIVCAINNEFIIYSFTAIFCLFFLYYLFAKFIIKSDKLIQIELSFKNFYIPAIIFFTSALWYVNIPGYKNIYSSRVPYINLLEIKNSFCDYTVSYIKVLFIDFIWYWIAFLIIFIFCIMIAKKKKEITKIIIPLFPVISALAILFSFVLCPKGSYENNFWFYRDTLQLSYRMICIIPLFIYLDYIFKNLRKRTTSKLFKTMIFTIIFISGIFFINIILTINSYVDFSDKQRNYIADKMLRFYYLKNETPILYRYNNGGTGCHSNLYNMTDPDIAGNEVDYVEYPDKTICTHKHAYIPNYYIAVYGQIPEELIESGIYYSYDAFEKFYENGGSFTQEELKKLPFSRLRDDNFVLGNKYQPIEVKELYFREK